MWAIVSKYKLYFIIAGALLVGGAAYLAYRHVYKNGYNSCVVKVTEEFQKELDKREEAYKKIYQERSGQKEKILDNIKKNPKNDKRDSCLLSGNPFRKECEGYLQ